MGASGTYDLVVVGAGISGLTLAYRVITARPSARVLVLEASPRLGGNLRTERTPEGYLIDAGPDSWVAQKPQASALAHELGLGTELIGTRSDTRNVYVSHQGKLHPMPEGLVLGIPTAAAPIVRTPLFSWAGKMRMALELFVPPRRSVEDETVENFLTRRLGAEVCERLAGPLLGGIFSGEPNELSMQTCFPSLLESEATYGSLILAMRARKAEALVRAGGASPPSAFTTLRGGVGALIEGLRVKLHADGVELRLQTQVQALTFQEGSTGAMRLTVGDGQRVQAAQVAFAGPSHVPERLLGSAAQHADFSLFRYASAATVFLAYDEAQLGRALNGLGFVVPKSENRAVTACTWVSSKWAGRAPSGKALVRLFFGGPMGQHWLERPDSDLVEAATREFAHYVGVQGLPELVRVNRFVRGTPGAPFGHLDRVRALRAQLARMAPGMHVLGNGYDGTGIPDCIRQAGTVAEQVCEKL